LGGCWAGWEAESSSDNVSEQHLMIGNGRTCGGGTLQTIVVGDDEETN